ncbi:MAG: hypothetical protein QOG92_2050 [Verrucomicrobiota bacterium]|nr:hypothetical protein [Verrucomicrobiota bacterium]
MKYNKMRRNLMSAFVAAALILPALAQAGTDKGKGNGGENNGNQYGRIRVMPRLRPLLSHGHRFDSFPRCGAGGWHHASLAPAKERWFCLTTNSTKGKPSGLNPNCSLLGAER